jgi:hypothetical protein
MVKGGCGGKIITKDGESWCEIIVNKKKIQKETKQWNLVRGSNHTMAKISIHNDDRLFSGDSSIACIPGPKGSSTTGWTVSPFTLGRATVGSPDL